MVKFYDSSFSHPYPFPTVTLAYFLRYPNPFSTHVLSTDVIDRHFDPDTNTLHTSRLHLKRSKIPSPILKLVPKSFFGASASTTGTSQSYILERSVVDIEHGVMITESRNLEFTGILAVAERQLYRRPSTDLIRFFDKYRNINASRPGCLRQLISAAEYNRLHEKMPPLSLNDDGVSTQVSTKVELQSKFGQIKERLKNSSQQQQPAKMGFFRSWGTESIQRSIEAIGLRRTERAVPKSEQGMNVVLERLRRGGLKAVLDGMRIDREMVVQGTGEG